MFPSREYISAIGLVILLTETLLLETAEARVIRKDLDFREIPKTNEMTTGNFPSMDLLSVNGKSQVTIGKSPGNHLRAKRSPYPPGFVIWSRPSAVIPCHCIPGDRKCKCLKKLELVAHRDQKKVVVRRRAKRNCSKESL